MMGWVFRPGWLTAFGLSLVAQIACGFSAEAANRLALVIGQSAYRDVPQLPNTANDAKQMAVLLTSAGFTVTTASDLSQTGMRQAIAAFAGAVAASGPDTIVAVFYAGHGLQIDGENFLVPVDIDPKRESDIPLQAVRLNDLMNTLGALPTVMRIYMLDACRNNPFPAISGTAGHGLAMIDTKAGAPGSFISFSTSPGAEAEDGTGANSPYTTALLTVAKDSIPIEEAFKRVRIAVSHDTDGRQIPWESSSLTSDFRFFGAGQSASPTVSQQSAARAATGPARTLEDWRKELQGKDVKTAYDLVIAADTIEGYEAFVALFDAPPYSVQLKRVAERRREMIAWSDAVLINTAASFQSFLNAYPNSDLAATARKLLERVRYRSLDANAAALPGPAIAALNPSGGGQGTNAPQSTSQPTNASAAPICTCSPGPAVVPPVIKKNVSTPQPSRKKRADAPRRIRVPTDSDIVESGRPAGPPPGPPPGAVLGGVGVSIGLGLGGLRGGVLRGPTRGPYPDAGGYSRGGVYGR